MKKAIWIVSALVTVIICMAYFFFKGSIQLNKKSDLFSFVSERNAIVLEFKYEADLSEILKSDLNFHSLFYESFISEIKEFDQIIKNNKAFEAALTTQDVIIAAQKLNSKELGCIYFANLTEYEIDDAATLFNSDDELVIKSKSRTFEGENIFHFEQQNRNFFYSYIEPYLLVSKHQKLIEDAIRAKAKATNFSKSPIFEKWQKEQAGSKSLLSVFVNHKSLPEFYSLFFDIPFQKSLGITADFADFSYTELNYKSDAWILNGEIEASEKKYFHLLKGQTENRSYLTNYLSSNTWAFQNIVLSDPVLFRNELQKLCALNQDFYFDAEQRLIEKKYGLNIKQLLNEHMGTELIAAYYPNYSILKHTGYISMLVLQQPEEFVKKIDLLQKNLKTTLYKDFSIKTFPIRKFMYLCGGEPFKELDAKYYVLIEDRLILSSDVEDIKRYLDDYQTEQLLKKKVSFQNYIVSLNDQYNYLFYCSVSGYEMSLKNLFNSKASTKVDNKNGWSNYNAFSYQVTSSDAGLINSIFLPIKENTSEASLEEKWQINLDAGAGSVAQWITTVDKSKHYIITQDDTNTIYLIDEESNIVWKSKIESPIISAIYPVDYYKNGQTQFLFNTSSRLYLLDIDGKIMPNYPIRLSVETNLGLSLFDYDKNKNYRIFIACTNQSIYGYDLSGRPLDGWNPKRVGTVIDRIQHVNVNNKDIIFVPTAQGYFYFLNRRGEQMAQFKDSAHIQYANPFYFDENTDYAKNRFISTDQMGKIKSLYVDGHRLYKSVGTWTDSHSFLYANVMGDDKKDYIFIDNNQLMVYQDDTTVGFNYQFNTTISDKAFAFQYNEKESLLGVISKETEQVFLFDREGKVLNGFPVKSFTKPSFLVTGNQKRMVVCTQSGKLIYYNL